MSEQPYMETLKREERWMFRLMELAELVASWSKDPNTKVGAVIADWDFRVHGIGYNGFPAGVADDDRRLSDREAKHACTVHAEINAIHNATKTRGLALYTTVVVRSLFRLMKERDPFIRLAGTGLACMFGVQAMINMGVAVRLLPAKGMTLPFVSYGGSSLVSAWIMIGLLMNIGMRRPLYLARESFDFDDD